MNMEQDENDAVIVRSTIDLGRNLGLRVVAEGVESEEIWSHLARLECELAQGYYLSRPMPGAALPDWLRARGAVPPLAVRYPWHLPRVLGRCGSRPAVHGRTPILSGRRTERELRSSAPVPAAAIST
jgi:EAL domain